MITEDYVSFEIAKLLKEKGFKEWCRKSYGIDVRYKGRTIDFDEECELKDEGYEGDIEYIDGGMLYNSGWDNSDENVKIYAAPTLWVAMKWLREVYKIEIYVHYDIDKITWWGECNPMYEEDEENSNMFQNLLGFDYPGKTYEEACKAAIKYCLKNLI